MSFDCSRLACAVSLLALLSQGCSSTPEEGLAAPSAAPATTGAMGSSNRRVFEGCNAAEEVRRYAGLVGQDVRIRWAWQDTRAASARVEVPAKVLRIDSSRVAVAFDSRVPNLELLTPVWLYSGHMHANPDGSFGVDPCSATLEKGGW